MTPPPPPSVSQPEMSPRRPNYLVPSTKPLPPRASRSASSRVRRLSGSSEVLRRALSPPLRRRGATCCHRRWNFCPVPSRLSNVSSA